jgi:exopolysaccharide biosynthesis polyprenyl glycosylphosphotransferase
MLPLLALIETAALFGASYLGLQRQDGALTQASLLTLCCVASHYYNDVYDVGVVNDFSDFLSRLWRGTAWSLILVAVAWTLIPGARISAGGLGIASLAMMAVLLPGRAAGYALLRCRPFRQRVLILGTGPLARLIGREVASRRHLRIDVIGFASEPAGDATSHDGPVCLDEDAELDRLIRELSPHRVVVLQRDGPGAIPIRKLVEIRLKGIAVEDGLEFHERVTGKIMFESVSPTSFVFGARSRRTRLHVAIGRAISLAVSAVGLTLTAPLYPLIALAIRMDSPGPIFYLQDRVGLHGRRFRMLKFRTMRSLQVQPSAWAGDNGDRITRVGGWLRKFRLDELPQFVNILLGDMNLVGPRPHPDSNFRLFAATIPQYELRLAVRPGVTGWAQTRYFYANNLEQETEKVRYDLYYIKHLSIWLDLRILFDTIKVVLLGRRSGMICPHTDPAREDQSSRVHDTAA